MTVKTAIANGLSKQDAGYSARIEKSLAQIKSIQKEIAARRTAGLKTRKRIDRDLKAIQAVIERVQATL